MKAYLATFGMALLVYLLFSAGSGTLLLWSAPEIVAAILVGALSAAVTARVLCRRDDFRMANPVRLLLLPVYLLGPFFLEVTRANLDVAYRVITGKVRPGIIRVPSGMKTDFGVFLLANSITLTPGTITVDVDEETNELFVHNINVPAGWESLPSVDARELFSLANIPSWIRRIAE
ncbi:MAG: Na+/H+ antiporter subunit E [Methanolinea sp.]